MPKQLFLCCKCDKRRLREDKAEECERSHLVPVGFVETEYRQDDPQLSPVKLVVECENGAKIGKKRENITYHRLTEEEERMLMKFRKGSWY